MQPSYHDHSTKPSEHLPEYMQRTSYQLREDYGYFTLSIVAGDNLYCEPRYAKLASLFDYTNVECAILTPTKTCAHPREVGIHSPRIAAMFESSYSYIKKYGGNTVAPYLTWQQVNDLRTALQRRARYLRDNVGSPEEVNEAQAN